jgi:hypothetical protein
MAKQVKLTYRGSGDFREISRKDFGSIGVEHDAIKVAHGAAVELSEEAAAWLLENESEAWKAAEASQPAATHDVPGTDEATKASK